VYFDFIIAPVTQYPAVAAATAACVMLGAGCKSMMVALERTAVQTEIGLAAQFQEIESTLQQLRAKVSEMSPPGARRSSEEERDKRAMALTLLHRGESPEMVAATLGAPRSEMELLMKVHRIVERQAR
jgi:hypothetical protein